VFFDNNTDQTLYLRARDLPPSGNGGRVRLPPHQQSSPGLVSKGQCTNAWLIYDENLVVVKDPGTMCWHDTISIP